MSVQPFERIVTEHGAVVMRVCRALLGQHDADDAWSDTFLAALRAYPSLRPDSNLRGWLVTIAHRKALDVLRVRGRAPLASDPVPEPMQPLVDEPDDPRLDSLEQVLASLPFKQRSAVAYHYLGGLPYRDVAQLLGCSEAAARRSASDGMAKLRVHYRVDGAPDVASTDAFTP